MGTPAHIYLKLKDESKGKIVKFHITKLAGSYCMNKRNLEYPIHDVLIPTDAQYMCVHHHFDSNVSDLGKTLLNDYNSYDKVLNLLVMGNLHSTSRGSKISGFGLKSYQGTFGDTTAIPDFITDTTRALKTKRDENGKLVKYNVPFLKKGKLPIENALRESYAYYFDGNEWYVAHCYWNEQTKKAVKSGWVKLTDIYAKVNAGKLRNW